MAYTQTWKVAKTSVQGTEYDLRNDVVILSSTKDIAATDIIDGGSQAGATATDYDELLIASVGRKSETYKLGANFLNMERVVIAEEDVVNTTTPDRKGTVSINIDAKSVANGLSILGNAGANNIIGTDVTNGSTVVDTIDGGDGNDMITGGAGMDSLSGGLGDDIFVINSLSEYGSGETINGSTGADSLVVYDTAGGTFTVDTITPNTFKSVENIYIGKVDAKGKVTSTGKEAINIDVTAAGNAGNLAVNVIGNAGDNAITGNKSVNEITGGAGMDTLIGMNGSDIFKFLKTTDVVSGETVNGDGGTDTLSDTAALYGSGIYKFLEDAMLQNIDNVVLYEKSGVDMTGQAEAWSVTGSDAVNTVITSTGSFNDYVDGGLGNDIIDTKDGNTASASLFGGGYFGDEIYGGLGNDKITSGTGNDYIDGGDGDDTITSGNSTASVGNGGDEIYGGAGKDKITSGNGNDYIEGGDGDDTIVSGDGVTATPNGWNYNLGGDEIYGGMGNDKITSGNGNDVIYGGKGNDIIDSGAGDDIIFADDNVGLAYTKGNSVDKVSGGAGSDTIVVEHVLWGKLDTLSGEGAGVTAGVGDIDTLIFAENTDQSSGTTGATFVVDIKKVTGFEVFSIDSDAFTAGNQGSANVGIDATTYQSEIEMYGNSGANMLKGGAKDDVIQGNAGADTLTGNAGNDQFVFNDTASTDTITDFNAHPTQGNSPNGDLLVFSDAIFDLGANEGTGTGTATAFTAGILELTGTTFASANSRFGFDTTTGDLYYDADGSGAGTSVKIATLSNIATISETDLAFIS